MKKNLLLVYALLMFAVGTFAQQTPLSANGQLQLVGNQLSNECGDPVQLRGMSTHGVMFHQNCYSEASVESLAGDWNSDLLRLAIYTEPSGGTNGYIDGDQDFWNGWIDNMVDYAKEQGMYVIIDWHILDDNDPNIHKEAAKDFFELMSERYADERHVIYEICNEPNGGTSWGQIKSYAEEVIPIIRANDSEGIILVGTPGYSSDVWAAANNPLTGNNAYNVMYTYHFYAGTHYGDRRSHLRSALSEVPVFISEWGATPASGDGWVDQNSADSWMSILDGNNNGGQLVSSANWSFVDKNEGSAALTSGSCETSDWNNRTTSGNYIHGYLNENRSFNECDAAADDDGDGVPNSDDNCPGTPAGTNVDESGCPALQGDADNDGIIDADDLCDNTPQGVDVNVNGCEITQDFVSNVCVGFNNYQGYAFHDFSEDMVPNLDYWNRPEDNSDVYVAEVSDGELVIDVTNADPDYASMGFSFGEIYDYNGTDYDTSLVPLDIRRNPVVEFDVYFESQSYGEEDVLVSVQIEDVDGNIANATAAGNPTRDFVDMNGWTTLTFNFEDAVRESYDEDECADPPCFYEEIDLSRINKVLMWVNPDAGANWSRPEYSGTWRMDDFSIGYDESNTLECTEIRDDDGDGVRNKEDLCADTPEGAEVNADGCADFQLDDDNDGVMNPDDECPETPEGEVDEVNDRGCSPSEADDDRDGVINGNDLCPDTQTGVEVDADGCSDAQRDDDNDGVVNANDECPETPEDASVDEQGCALSQLDSDGDNVTDDIDQCPNTNEGAEVDETGCVVTSIMKNTNSNLTIYPVPAHDNVTIDQTIMNFNDAKIMNMNGETINHVQLTSPVQQISLLDMPEGMYIIQLSGNDKLETYRMIIK